jgi:hypothetical protein
MLRQDRFLIGIVAAAVLLVVVAFVVAYRQPPPTYRAEDTPAGVAYNYLLALQQQDYERAYGYLSPTLYDYPRSAEEFVDELTGRGMHGGRLDSVTLDVQSTDITGDLAVAEVEQTTFTEGGLFESGQYTSPFTMQLRRVDGAWKLVESQDYWSYCWSQETDRRGCPTGTP